MESHRQIIEVWGRKQMALDLKVPEERVRGWWRKSRLPQQYWRDALKEAPKRNIEISPNLLIDLAARD